MSIEIERKFLVKSSEFKKISLEKIYIKQGFLNSDKRRVVRVRKQNDQGFLTIKGLSFDNGSSRYEWEKEISINDIEPLLLLCEKQPIEKIRYLVKSGKHIIEVDEFLGVNNGLYLAEIELSHKKEPFEKPSWLGKEVTGIKKYYNANLSKKPYKNWKKKAPKLN
ncbi:MAG: CYTH domain-containing protein [Flavobacteriaceae bacterium]|nr:CYTH domain-containing protein [Flavobacteriaceae bacterium]